MRAIPDNELRIGNLVEDFHHYTTVVETIIPEHERLRYPIPLTAEWMERLGFEKVNHIHGYVLWHHKKSNIQIEEGKTLYRGVWVKHCEYVHQLQNLYFALTGEELTPDNKRKKV